MLIWASDGKGSGRFLYRTDAGNVYAYRRASGKRFQLLALDPTCEARLVSRFRREAEQLSNINHPNLQRVIGVADYEGRPVALMDDSRGTRLSDWLDRVETLSVGDALAVVLQCSAGLAELHGHGLVYRRLSPKEIWVDSAGIVRLQPWTTSDFTATALTSGTGNHHMAPEQIQAGAPIADRIDVYALGSMFYELLAGRTPFAGDTSAEVLMNVINDEPTSLSEIVPSVPQALSDVVLTALEKAPGDRPNVQKFAQQLRAFGLENEHLEFLT